MTDVTCFDEVMEEAAQEAVAGARGVHHVHLQ